LISSQLNRTNAKLNLKPPYSLHRNVAKESEGVMTEDLINRKLSAILSADAKDYSRLMRSDEEATVRTLTKYRSVIAELVSKYQGRVVDSPGDNVLAEFASVVHAVQCGFDI